jgi:hypothetical protein
LDETRRKLVETGTRNRLIHVNRTKTRGNILNIVNERSDDVYSILAGGKTMRFRAIGTDQEEENETVSLANDEAGFDKARYTDAELETRLGPSALQKKLLKIAREAKTAEEEQGVNILYLALGFLKWFEDESSKVTREAPLVLLPVELVRNQRTSTYDIRVRDEDVVTNLPLQERLSGDFGILLPEIAIDDDWKPYRYFDGVEEVVASKTRWSIDRDGIQLGFFSFSKLLMYRDLAPEAWPEDALADHPLARGLLYEGFEPESDIFGPDDRLDDVLPPSKLFHVVDADASQAKVIEEVRAGRNLVVQGPPGTGKSQTITNIIAAAAMDGKTVLFVAEKMAALSVVYSRLVKVGLQDICLELHSKSANKKSVVGEFARTLASAQSQPPIPGEPAALTQVRDQLNSITEGLHRPIGKTGETPFSLLARQARFIGAGMPPPNIKIDRLAHLDRSTEDTLCEALEAYSKLVQRAGSPKGHPLQCVRKLDFQPVDLTRLSSALDKARKHVQSFAEAIQTFHAATGVKTEVTIGIIPSLVDILERLEGFPQNGTSVVRQLFSISDHARLARNLAEGAAWKKARVDAEDTFVDAAFSISATPLRSAIARGAASFLTRWGSSYRKASGELSGVLRRDLPKRASERLTLAARLADIQESRERWRAEEDYCARTLGELWRGERTDFETLHACSEWIGRLGAAELRIDVASAIELAVSAETRKALWDRLKQAEQAKPALLQFMQLLLFDFAPLGASNFDEVDLRNLASRLELIRGALDRYGEWAELNRAREPLITQGLASLLQRMEAGTLTGSDAAEELRYARAELLWRHALDQFPPLRGIGSVKRHALVERFMTLEREHLKGNVTTIRARHLNQVPQGAMGEMRVIRGEIGRRRGHMPLRRLFKAAGSAIQRIKPVVLMSPISVAQFLQPGTLSFDLLVIDEASQVRPEDALGAIARARQIVVVGDQKQLPPTSFFDRLLADDEGVGRDEDDDLTQTNALGGAAQAAELESILSLCEARGLNARMLRWHYRSRDPSLIRVSNREFYNDDLVLPPSPLEKDPAYGLCFTRVNGAYDKGGKRDNRIEGEAIVKRMAEHARTHPDLSLGIATFSASQRDLITELLELARRSDHELDEFLREGKREDVFVKNIENVQGDERDVILVSVGYGPTAPGGRLSSMSFGPVNADGGERRLNVLFTRARVRCEIFASFDPGDIDPTRVSRDGPRIFKRFLDFAKSGQIEQSSPTGEAADTPFEEDVAEVIQSFGFLADPQVGSAGFRIDLGVRHPERPGTYILAVECDGATYHHALWARERDRLRQDVLEQLGWRFHRIWSTDWFYNRRAEIERLRTALSKARELAEKGIKIEGANRVWAIAAEVPDEGPIEVPAPVERKMPDYVRASIPVRSSVEPHEADPKLLAELAIRIIEIEGPIHVEDIARRIAASFGRDRAGSRINSATREALRRAEQISSDIQNEDSFWMTRGQHDLPPVRDRSADETAPSKASNISLRELGGALRIAREDNAGGDSADLIRTAARLLGFRRVGPELQARLSAALREMDGVNA